MKSRPQICFQGPPSMPKSGNKNSDKSAVQFLVILKLVSGFTNRMSCINNPEESCTKSGQECL